MRLSRCSRLCEEGYWSERSQVSTRCPIKSSDFARFISRGTRSTTRIPVFEWAAGLSAYAESGGRLQGESNISALVGRVRAIESWVYPHDGGVAGNQYSDAHGPRVCDSQPR